MASSTYIDWEHPGTKAVPNAAGLAGTGAASASAAGNAVASANLPGYMTSMSNIGTNIARETAGQVPEDVINLLKQQGAESNVSTGAASNAAYLRSLGLTSLGLMDTGQKNLEDILKVTPGFAVSQGSEFQTSANLSYEAGLQQQVFQRQQQQQQLAFDEQMKALKTAQSGINAGAGGSSISWGNPTNSWSGGGVDALGFPNITTADLPGQTSAGGATSPGGYGGGVAYGGGGDIEYW